MILQYANAPVSIHLLSFVQSYQRCETTWHMEAKFYMEPPWVGELAGNVDCNQVTYSTWQPCSQVLKSSQNQFAEFHETLYVANGTPAHHSWFR